MYIYTSVSYGADLEHEGIAKFDGQFQLFDEVGVVEGGDTEVVSLLLLAYPVEGLLLRINAEGVARCLQGRGGEGRGRGRGGEGESNSKYDSSGTR